MNDTIKNNIALGEKEENINLHSIEKALTLSNSKKFVEKLTNYIETDVGNRGVSISGGQKQRIGIARAFYETFKNFNFR